MYILLFISCYVGTVFWADWWKITIIHSASTEHLVTKHFKLCSLALYPKVTVTHKDCWGAEDGSAKYPQNTEWASTTYTAIC